MTTLEKYERCINRISTLEEQSKSDFSAKLMRRLNREYSLKKRIKIQILEQS